ncbi:helix-turn-helix transcriptional regulator [Aquirufa rosea]|uniref:XRE family transcriptional regulator n=1 Tax=Aquirufa rosea TaxID=2509241 RepID=A0A4Q1BX05_9BACT|nr:helix-turn-helix transcriptional regulator [Aquirufa rosea]RXK46504.1 XRE family transcriptional regulator [Aquirufa rosea]
MLRLKEILEKKRMTQVELSKKLGVSTVTVNLWAKNKSEPSLRMILKICEILKIKLSELVEQ